MSESAPLAGHSIQMRRAMNSRPKRLDVAVTQIVTEHHNKIRLRCIDAATFLSNSVGGKEGQEETEAGYEPPDGPEWPGCFSFIVAPHQPGDWDVCWHVASPLLIPDDDGD